MSTFRTAYVYVRNNFAGMLSETDSGYAFTYDQAFLNHASASPVLLTLPLREKPFLANTLFSFFDGRIPEGWLLDVTTRKRNYFVFWYFLLLRETQTCT